MRYRLGVSLILASVSYSTIAVTPANATTQATNTITLDFPRQNLANALMTLAELSNLDLIFDAKHLRRVRSNAIRGNYQPLEALRLLLRDTGMTYHIGASGAIVVAPASGSAQLRETAEQGRQTPSADASVADLDDAGSPFDWSATDEIIVTARGRVQNLQDVPVSVSVTSGDKLERSNITNLETLSEYVPGFKIATAPTADFVTVRGVGSSLNHGFEQSVGTFVDGIYRGRSRSTRSGLFDVERVEVLKGPQTTFFGNNTIAGAINITTRKPRHEFAVNGLAYYVPATGAYTLEAGITQPLSETLSVRAAGRLSGMDGYIKDDTRDTEGPNVNDKLGRISFLWEPSSSVELNARLDVGRTRNTDVGNFELLECPPPAEFDGQNRGACGRYLAASGGQVDDVLDWHANTNPSFFNNDFLEAAVNGKVDLGGPTLSFTTGYFRHHYTQNNDVIPIPGGLGASVIPGFPVGLNVNNEERYDQFSQEIRVQSPEDVPVSYILGAYYQKSDLDITQNGTAAFAPFWLFVPVVPVGTPVGSSEPMGENAETLSAFAASTVTLSPEFRLSFGLRYTRVHKEAYRDIIYGTPNGVFVTDSGLTPYPPGADLILGPVFSQDLGNFDDPTRTDSKLLPSASVEYDITPDIMAYASYSAGFKAGGFSMGADKSVFDPEHIDAFEAGLKSNLFDRRLMLNLAAFYSKYKDLQETSTVLGAGQLIGRQVVGNVAGTTVNGFEANARLVASENVQLFADVAYIDAKYTDYVNGPCTSVQAATLPAPCVQDLSDQRRAFAPKFSGNAGLNVNAPITADLKLRFDTTAYFTTRFLQQPTADPRLAQPGYVKIDARLALASIDDRWELAVVGKNLTNKLTASFRQIVPTAIGSISALSDPPRTIGFQASFRY